jgi:hypothetical protein
MKPAELADLPPFPEELRYLWNWYFEMDTAEQLTFSEIMANAEVMGVVPEPREAELLLSIDKVRAKVAYEDVKA